MAKHRVGIQRGLDQRVIDKVELQCEEQHVRAGVRQLLLHVAIELGAGRIRGVAGIEQACIGADASHHVLKRLVFTHGRTESAAGTLASFLGELAFPALLEGIGIGRDLREVALELGRIHGGIEVRQVPFRQSFAHGSAFLGAGGRGVGAVIQRRHKTRSHDSFVF